MDGDLHHPHDQEVVATQRPALPGDQHGPVGRGLRQQAAEPGAALDHPGEKGLRPGIGVLIAAGADVDADVVVDCRADPRHPSVVLVERDRCQLARLGLDQVHPCEDLPGQVPRQPTDGPLGQRAGRLPGGGHLGASQQVGDGVDGGHVGVGDGGHDCESGTAADAKEPARCRTCDTVRSVSDEARRERFEALVPALVDPLRRFLARRTDPATADDVLAETLLVCWRRLDDAPGGAAALGLRRGPQLPRQRDPGRTPPGAARGPDRRRRPAGGDHRPVPGRATTPTSPRRSARCARRTPSCSGCGPGSS